MLGEKLSASLGQPIVVDNRGGAGGILGTEIVAKAVPDGYTLLLVPTGHVINPSIYAKLPYDTAKAVSLISVDISYLNAAVNEGSHLCTRSNGETSSFFLSLRRRRRLRPCPLCAKSGLMHCTNNRYSITSSAATRRT